MSSPRLLLLDEPTIGRVLNVCMEIAEALQRSGVEFNVIIFIKEQNTNFAMTFAEHLYVLEPGKIKI